MNFSESSNRQTPLTTDTFFPPFVTYTFAKSVYLWYILPRDFVSGILGQRLRSLLSVHKIFA